MTAIILWAMIGIMTALYGLHVQIVETGEINLADILVSLVCVVTGPLLALIVGIAWLSENSSNIVLYRRKP